jgi:hypothetical protein
MISVSPFHLAFLVFWNSDEMERRVVIGGGGGSEKEG